MIPSGPVKAGDVLFSGSGFFGEPQEGFLVFLAGFLNDIGG
jgi:hypothetical protein